MPPLQEHSCGVRLAAPHYTILPMDGTDSNAANAASVIRAWMLDVLQSKGLSANAWARSAGLASSTVQKAIKPDYQFTTSSRTIAKLADAAGVSPPDIATVKQARVTPRLLPVRYRVQAGLWYEVDSASQSFLGEHPVAPDPRFDQHPQWLEEVVGDSINLKISEGAFAHVIDAISMGYAARAGDLVVVERRLRGGQIKERTIKQVAIGPGGETELWPRSSNPKWNTPTLIANGDEEEMEVEIVGLVVGAYQPLSV